MDAFGVCFLIGVGGFFLFRIIRRVIRKENIETIRRYRNEYPQAYIERFPKDSLYDWDLESMSFSDLSERASLSEYSLKQREQTIKNEKEKKRREEYERRKREEEARRKAEEEKRQARLEAERKQREIDNKYQSLLSRYPHGVKLYQKTHPSSSTKEKIILLSRDIFESYEEQYREHQFFVDWKGAQDSFASICRDKRDTVLDNWGCFWYNAEVSGTDELGKPQAFKFKIWQLFCDCFCYSTTVDYSYYPNCKQQRDNIPQFLRKERHFYNRIYDKVVSFIEALPGNALVNIGDSNLGDTWQAIEEYHFGYLEQKLTEKGIPFVAVDHLPPSTPLHKGPVVFVELISNNKKLIEKCSRFLQLSSGDNLTLVYISLLKEYDEEELLELNQRKESEIKEAADRERREREERVRKEREEAERKAREAREAEERRQREEAARRAREERVRLNTLAHTQKANAWEFRNYFSSNGIRYLYHFTDRRNLDSIRRNGGLYSWYYCENHNIDIPYPGGGEQSRSLDRWHGLQDYVRLSFCDDHPMAYRLKLDGYNLVLLRIRIDVAFLEETLFSDINAADGAHHHGPTMDDLRRVDLNATQQHFVSASSSIFKKHQAEVLVKTFVPLEYIENIDNPISI